MIESTIEKAIQTSTFVETNGAIVKQPEANQANNPLSPELLGKINAYWRAANYRRSARFIFTTTRC